MPSMRVGTHNLCFPPQYRDMLDFLVALGETRDAGVAQDVTARARAAVEKVRLRSPRVSCVYLFRVDAITLGCCAPRRR